MLTVSQKVFNYPPSSIHFIVYFCSDLSRFTSSVVGDVALGIAIGTFSDPVHTDGAYGSLVQLVILCARRSTPVEAYKWEELNTAPSDVMQPLAVDILSPEYFAENAEARIQACIPSVTVHLHTVLSSNKRWQPQEVIQMF